MSDREKPPKGHPNAGSGNSSGGEIVKVVDLRGYSEVEFSRHALDQMSIRRITKDDVFRTIRNPDLTELPTQKGRLRFRCYRGNLKAIDVIFEERRRLIVITAMRVSLHKNERPEK